MHRLFADTFYWIALLYRRDPWHARVTAFSQTLTDADIVWTTDAVFVELLAAVSAGRAHMRHEAVLLVDEWLNDPSVRVMEATHGLFLDGLSLYRVRPDKADPTSTLWMFLIFFFSPFNTPPSTSDSPPADSAGDHRAVWCNGGMP